MKRIAIVIAVIVSLLLCLCSCSKTSNDSTFSIQFIDVGQGDAALVECDGHYMLIDGGDVSAKDKMYNVLKEKDIKHLDILVATHLHTDHIGGLSKALTYVSEIDLTISNNDYADTTAFREFEYELGIVGSKITIPAIGTKYKLGSANVEVIDVSAEENNDSVVLLITYGKTKFLFTGDIEETAQKRIYEKYANDEDKPFKVDLVKMPHHGAYTNTLYPFLRTFMPDYTIISVGENNKYGHPRRETMDLLDSKTWKPQVYRTDLNGDIIVKSNGEELLVETSK